MTGDKLAALIGLLLIATFVGIVKPYIPGSKRSYFVVAFIALSVLNFALTAQQSDSPAPTGNPAAKSEDGPVTSAGSNSASEREPSAVSQSESNWTYSQRVDEMRGDTERFASLTSENEVSFDFPYTGGAAELDLRRRKKDGVAVMLSIPSGQFLCDNYFHPSVSVKFDQGPVQNYPCVEPNDGTSNVIFIRNESSFIKKLRTSKRVTIEPEFFRQGTRQFEFRPAGLNWQ